MGFGNGKGSGSFGATPTGFGGKGGPPPSFGEGPFHCNLLIKFRMRISHLAVRRLAQAGQTASLGQTTTMQLYLSVRKRCQEVKAEEGGTITVRIDKVAEAFPGRSESAIPKKDICKTFDGIEGTETIEPEAISDLMKDLSNATNEMGADFSLGDFMSSLCTNTDEGTAFYSVELTCKKNIGTCKEIADSPDPVEGLKECEKDLAIMIVMPGLLTPNVPFGGSPNFSPGLIGGNAAVIDPCSLSNLLKCWKENPDADTSLSDDAQDDIMDAIPWGVLLGAAPSHDLINTVTDIVLTDAKKKCKKKE